MLWPKCPSVVAVASDAPVDCSLPVLNLQDPPQIASFICDHVGVINSPAEVQISPDRRHIIP